MAADKDLTVIGRAEHIRLLDHGEQLIPAKVDTGADLSSVWATQVSEKEGKLSFVLFDERSKFYTGKRIELDPSEYRQTRIENSFGDKELRYIVKLRVEVKNRKIKASFTLANRGKKTYPILLGRRFLHKKFLVDVTQGQPLVRLEKEKKRKLEKDLKTSKG